MIDRIFSALLTFCVLAGGTAAIASAMLDSAGRHSLHSAARPTVMQLPTVQVVVRRLPAASDSLARAEATEPAQRSTQ
jgi:hypothetical protein